MLFRSIGIVLTGANTDGAKGLKAIKARRGLAIVQNPETAQAAAMPRAALEATAVDYLVDLQNIAPLLIRVGAMQEEADGASG